MSEPKTVGEALLDQISKISDALTKLQQQGLPKELLVLWIHKKTRLPQREIRAILEALQEINKEFQKPLPTQRGQPTH
ncbi:MAG: hypothetical protein QXH20_02430 [Candidatus Bathyarchaeia archaeon]